MACACMMKYLGRGPLLCCCTETAQIFIFFDALTALLEPRYTVYRLDSRRHGKSEKTKEISYDLMAQDTAAFIQALGLSRRTALYSARRGVYQLSEKTAGFSGPCGGFPA